MFKGNTIPKKSHISDGFVDCDFSKTVLAFNTEQNTNTTHSINDIFSQIGHHVETLKIDPSALCQYCETPDTPLSTAIKVTTTCKHTAHIQCFLHFISSLKYCPICEQKFTIIPLGISSLNARRLTHEHALLLIELRQEFETTLQGYSINILERKGEKSPCYLPLFPTFNLKNSLFKIFNYFNFLRYSQSLIFYFHIITKVYRNMSPLIQDPASALSRIANRFEVSELGCISDLFKIYTNKIKDAAANLLAQLTLMETSLKDIEDFSSTNLSLTYLDGNLCNRADSFGRFLVFYKNHEELLSLSQHNIGKLKEIKEKARTHTDQHLIDITSKHLQKLTIAVNMHYKKIISQLLDNLFNYFTSINNATIQFNDHSFHADSHFTINIDRLPSSLQKKICELLQLTDTDKAPLSKFYYNLTICLYFISKFGDFQIQALFLTSLPSHIKIIINRMNASQLLLLNASMSHADIDQFTSAFVETIDGKAETH